MRNATLHSYYHWLGDEADAAAAEAETLEQLARELPFLDAADDD